MNIGVKYETPRLTEFQINPLNALLSATSPSGGETGDTGDGGEIPGF